MSRTFGMTTPSRRSKRLLKNGYYQVAPNDVANWLDAPPSDEDDTTSIDSNLSKLSFTSEQRRVMYKESPTNVFSHRRRNNSGSPRRNHQKFGGTSQMDSPQTSGVKVRWTNHNARGRQRAKLTNTKSTMNVVAQEDRTAPVFGTISAPAVTPQRRELARREHPSNHLHGFVADDETDVHHTNNLGGGEQVRLRQARTRESTEPLAAAVGDGTFKVPSPKTRTEQHFTQTQVIKSSSEVMSLSQSYSSDDDIMEDTTSEDHRSTSQSSGARSRDTTEGPILFAFRIVQFYAAYLATVIWEIGRFVYQGVTRLLVLDTWLLTRSIEVKPVAPTKMSRLKKMLLFLFALIFGLFVLYFGLSSLYRKEQAPIFASPFSFADWFGTTDPPSYTAEMRSSESIQRSLQKLELSLREMELRIADRHANVLNKIKLLQTGYEVNLEKLSESQKNVLTNFEDRMEKHISLELLKNNEYLQDKLYDVQLELGYLRANHTSAVHFLRNEIGSNVELNKGASQELLDKLTEFEKKLLAFDGKVDILRKDHSLFKASTEKHAGNITFLKEISNNQFVENFLFLLQKGSSGVPKDQQPQGPSENRRYQFLSLVFLEWLGKRGFVQENALQKMQEQILQNSSQIEKNFKQELEKSIIALKKAAKAKAQPGITLHNMVAQTRHTSKISEGLVKAWIQDALNLYSADRIGLPDFALESAGASIVNTRCSESFEHRTALVSILGIPIYYNINTPRSVIQPSVMPGECWAFKGSQGFVVISLSSKILPTAFTLEHIPKALALYNNISSAPKDFSVYGLNSASDTNGILLGTFRYDESGNPIQHFEIDDTYKVKDTFSFIEARIASNWGHPDFTCLYRFRVHGQKAD